MYSAVFGIISVGLMTTFSSVYKYYLNVQVKTNISHSLRFTSQVIQQAISETSGVSTSSGSTLVLGMNTDSKTPTEFGLLNGRVYKKEGSGSMVFISPENLEVTDLSFSYLSSLLTEAIPPNEWAWSGGGSASSTNEGIGWIDFNPPTGKLEIPIGAGDFYGMAYVPGMEEYISFNCVSTDSCDTVPYKVSSSASGDVSGWAWSSELGWISFNSLDASSSIPYKVTISSSTGAFSGWAWSENVGWISLNCANTEVNSCGTVNYKVQANRKQSVPSNTVFVTMSMRNKSLVSQFRITDTYGFAAPVSYVSNVTVSSVAPSTGTTTVTFIITGTNFKSGVKTKLTRAGFSDITSTVECTLVGSTSLQSCQYDVTGKQTGLWSVMVLNSDGQVGVLPGGFGISEIPQASPPPGSPTPTPVPWYNTQWGYRSPISITNWGSTLTNYDTDVDVNTLTLISQGKMQGDCDDIRITDSDGTTLLTYWVEGGCNTSYSQLWVSVPSIPNGEKIIYMYHGNVAATNAEASWTGNFEVLSNSSCPIGWTRDTALDSKFPYASSTSAVAGGSTSHAHGNTSIGMGGVGCGFITTGGAASAQGCAELDNNHSGITSTIGTNSSVEPPYLDMVFCKANDLEADTNTVAMFEGSVSGWTQFSALNSKFPRGASSYGGAGGGTTHTHSYTGGTSGPSSGSPGVLSSGDCPAAVVGHTHTIFDGNTNGGNSLPSYTTVVYAQSDAASAAPAGTMVFADAVPPLGWTRKSSLDNTFLYGSATYGTTGGSATHTHTISGSSNGSGSSFIVKCPQASGVYVIGGHDHGISGTTNANSNVPPYSTLLVIQKKTQTVSTVVGGAEAKP